MKRLLNKKFQFKYDIHSKKGKCVTDKGEYLINLEKDIKIEEQAKTFCSGSCGEGYGINLI